MDSSTLRSSQSNSSLNYAGNMQSYDNNKNSLESKKAMKKFGKNSPATRYPDPFSSPTVEAMELSMASLELNEGISKPIRKLNLVSSEPKETSKPSKKLSLVSSKLNKSFYQISREPNSAFSELDETFYEPTLKSGFVSLERETFSEPSLDCAELNKTFKVPSLDFSELNVTFPEQILNSTTLNKTFPVQRFDCLELYEALQGPSPASEEFFEAELKQPTAVTEEDLEYTPDVLKKCNQSTNTTDLVQSSPSISAAARCSSEEFSSDAAGKNRQVAESPNDSSDSHADQANSLETKHRSAKFLLTTDFSLDDSVDVYQRADREFQEKENNLDTTEALESSKSEVDTAEALKNFKSEARSNRSMGDRPTQIIGAIPGASHKVVFKHEIRSENSISQTKPIPKVKSPRKTTRKSNSSRVVDDIGDLSENSVKQAKDTATSITITEKPGKISVGNHHFLVLEAKLNGNIPAKSPKLNGSPRRKWDSSTDQTEPIPKVKSPRRTTRKSNSSRVVYDNDLPESSVKQTKDTASSISIAETPEEIPVGNHHSLVLEAKLNGNILAKSPKQNGDTPAKSPKLNGSPSNPSTSETCGSVSISNGGFDSRVATVSLELPSPSAVSSVAEFLEIPSVESNVNKQSSRKFSTSSDGEYNERDIMREISSAIASKSCLSVPQWEVEWPVLQAKMPPEKNRKGARSRSLSPKIVPIQ